jgi:uncharacterized RDD family membrane protein YckC
MSSMESSYAGTGAVELTSARAGFWRRFAASFIDGILIWIVTVIALLVFGSAAYVLYLVLQIGYFTYFHGSSGQTPGDAALSIRVVGKDDGAPIGYGRAFVRWLVSIISGWIIVLGYLWMLWDGEKQTWHDKAANSVVVPAG